MNVIKNRKMILLVVHSCSFTGAPLLGLNITKNLKKRGYHVFVICLEKGILYNQYKKYGTILFAKNNLAAKIYIKLLRLIGVKHAICNSTLSGDITKIANENKMYVISLVHELPGAITVLKAKEKANNLSAFSNKVIFPNYFVKNRFVELLHVKEDKFAIKPQGLYMKLHPSYDEKTRLLKKKEMGFLPQDKIVIGVGVGGKTKGIDLFYDVASKIQKIDKNIKFMWIGGIDQRYQWVERQAHNIGIKLIPPTNQIEDYYRIADLYLLSSREDSFPSVVLEAIAYGLPVLGFKDAGGFIEIDERFIHLADYLNCNAMSELVTQELSDTERIAYIKKNGRKFIKNHYNFSSYVDWLLTECDLSK